MEFRAFEDLRSFLETFTSWNDGTDYDFGGAVALLGACLDSLRRGALEAEMEELPERLSPEQVEFVLKLAGLLEQSRRQSGV